MSNKHYGSNGKGYYIALILCAVGIGISGYLYYRNTDNETLGNQADATVSATVPEEHVAAVATQPQSVAPEAVKPEEPTLNVKEPMKTMNPVEGEVIGAFSMDALSYNQTTRDWRVHNGMDIAAEAGTEVMAAADGEVYTVYEDETMGMTVVIRHADGYSTRYSSLSEALVQPGDTVSMGDAIGCVGESALLESAIGSHLHFSVSCNGEDVDPEEFLGK